MVAEHQHLGGQADARGARGEVAEGRERVPVRRPALRGDVGGNRDVLAAGQVVEAEPVGCLGDRGELRRSRPPSSHGATAPGTAVTTGLTMPTCMGGSSPSTARSASQQRRARDRLRASRSPGRMNFSFPFSLLLGAVSVSATHPRIHFSFPEVPVSVAAVEAAPAQSSTQRPQLPPSMVERMTLILDAFPQRTSRLTLEEVARAHPPPAVDRAPDPRPAGAPAVARPHELRLLPRPARAPAGRRRRRTASCGRRPRRSCTT